MCVRPASQGLEVILCHKPLEKFQFPAKLTAKMIQSSCKLLLLLLQQPCGTAVRSQLLLLHYQI